MDSWFGVIVSLVIISVIAIGGLFLFKKYRPPELLKDAHLGSEMPIEPPSVHDWD
jgi:hypothetical protein